jgi:hypothetical protein
MNTYLKYGLIGLGAVVVGLTARFLIVPKISQENIGFKTVNNEKIYFAKIKVGMKEPVEVKFNTANPLSTNIPKIGLFFSADIIPIENGVKVQISRMSKTIKTETFKI